MDLEALLPGKNHDPGPLRRRARLTAQLLAFNSSGRRRYPSPGTSRFQESRIRSPGNGLHIWLVDEPRNAPPNCSVPANGAEE